MKLDTCKRGGGGVRGHSFSGSNKNKHPAGWISFALSTTRPATDNPQLHSLKCSSCTLIPPAHMLGLTHALITRARTRAREQGGQ